MKPARILALIVGCLLALPAIGLLIGGGALGTAYLAERDDDGYFDVTIGSLESETAAVTAEDLDLRADPGDPDWLLDSLDVDIRLRVTPVVSDKPTFVGIAPESDVDNYLSGVAHDEIVDLDDDLVPQYQSRLGTADIGPPSDEDFWVVSASGTGTQELVWEAQNGQWAVVVMNADGTPNVAADVNVGAKSGFVLPLALILLGAGLVVGSMAVTLIIVGARGARAVDSPDHIDSTSTPPPPGATSPWGPEHARDVSPVALSAVLDPELSRWKWLVKWILAIPHFIVLAVLWVGFVLMTIAAGFAILFTGEYPRGLFNINVGILRWTWRVTYYATNGGIGSDVYPPFSLHEEPGDHARLNVAYPERLNRPRVLVKWLLALPHLIIVSFLTGSTVRWLAVNGDRLDFDPLLGGGLLGFLTLVAGVFLLFKDRYPQPLFDLIIGLNRWIYRTTAYVALMTDDYPPFRLDQGGNEPLLPSSPRSPTDDSGAVDLTKTERESLII